MTIKKQPVPLPLILTVRESDEYNSGLSDFFVQLDDPVPGGLKSQKEAIQ